MLASALCECTLLVLATAEADINHIDMGEEAAQETTDLRFVIAVRDLQHLDVALRGLRRVPSVIRAERIFNQTQGATRSLVDF